MPAPREARLHWGQRMARIPVLLLIFNRIRQALGCRCQFATVGEWGPLLLPLLPHWCSSTRGEGFWKQLAPRAGGRPIWPVGRLQYWGRGQAAPMNVL